MVFQSAAAYPALRRVAEPDDNLVENGRSSHPLGRTGHYGD